MTTTPRIAIVGGGPAGLLCARVLQGHGIQPAVYDADTAVDSRDPGGTLDLHADAGQIALADAGLMDAFLARARIEGQAKTRRDHHGTLLAEFTPAAGDKAAPEIDRGRLRAMLYEHLMPDTVHWGHKLRNATPIGGGAHRLEFTNQHRSRPCHRRRRCLVTGPPTADRRGAAVSGRPLPRRQIRRRGHPAPRGRRDRE